MYAKIINEETKEVRVGLGTNTEFYKSIGMTEMEVEQAYNGYWYVKGYEPEKPESLIIKEKVEEARAFLTSTDWCVVKIAEAETVEGQSELREKYADTIKKRKEARELINEYENSKEIKDEQH